MTACSIDGCSKSLVARGWCHAHYKKWQLHGDPTHGRTYERERGDGTINHSGYVAVTVGASKKMQHVLVAEAALGKPLPAGAIVHHVDRDRANNVPTNLVICPDQAYHKLLHMRMDAMDACGNPDFRKCVHCREYDSPEAMTKTGSNANGHRYYHKACHAKAEYERKNK